MTEQSEGERQPARFERRFALLKSARRIWAVGSIHGEASLLIRLHGEIAERWQPFDRIVYLGNLIGRGAEVLDTMDELLAFRRAVLALPHAIPEDVVYLRGSQEEMWHKLLQLQFATDPRGVLKWMLDHGVGATLQAYGGRTGDGLVEARQGALLLTRWTSGLRQAMQRHPGHFQIMSELRRAAMTADQSFLFVNAGLDPTRPLEAQSDTFWWGHAALSQLGQPFGGFGRVVRGFDPRHPGIDQRPHVLTLDGGAGFGGPLVAALLSPGSGVVERLEIAP